MNKENFESRMREVLRREPFQPFLIALKDGRRYAFDRPRVAVNAGGAGFLDDREGIVDFECDEVDKVLELSAEPAS